MFFIKTLKIYNLFKNKIDIKKFKKDILFNRERGEYF